jgi:predicted aspartyl protease
VPSFTSQVSNLQAVGPIVELRIAVGAAVESALRKAGTALPGPVPAVAMIDTGATGTVIRQGLAAQLGLNPVGVTHISTPSSTNVACYEYVVRLLFPNNVLVETTVLEAPLQGQHIQCLIGRDVLAHGVLVYIGYGNLFSLSF